MNVILFGATGMVGQVVLRECLRDDGVEGVLRFVPGIGDLVVSILSVNLAVAYFNIVVGIVLLLIAFASRRSRVTES